MSFLNYLFPLSPFREIDIAAKMVFGYKFAQFISVGRIPNHIGKIEKTLQREVDSRIVVDVDGDNDGPIYLIPPDKIIEFENFVRTQGARVLIWDKSSTGYTVG